MKRKLLNQIKYNKVTKNRQKFSQTRNKKIIIIRIYKPPGLVGKIFVKFIKRRRNKLFSMGN
jgi:hypothetical protein